MKYLKSFNINEASNGLIIIQDCKDILLELSDLGYEIDIRYVPLHTDMYDNKINYRPDLLVKIEVTDQCWPDWKKNLNVREPTFNK